MCFALSVCDADQSLRFDSNEQANAYQALLKEMRCVTCPNQNIAETDSPLAKTIRQDIYEQLLAGQSPAEIRQDLIARYGENLSYRPPFSWQNSLLWLGPVGLLLFGLIIWRNSHAH